MNEVVLLHIQQSGAFLQEGEYSILLNKRRTSVLVSKYIMVWVSYGI